MTKIIYTLTFLTLFSCGTEQTQSNYSKSFYNYFKKNNIILQSDSLIFPLESGLNEPILIPTFLKLNQEYWFVSKNGIELKVRRSNFTDLEFELRDNEIIESGFASLRPNFYLGSESVGTSEGEYWVTDYDVENSTCVSTLKIGNQDLSNDGPNEAYAFLDIEINCNDEKLKGISELWKLKK